MSTLPNQNLETRAADERRRLHSSVTELRLRVREKLDVKKTARRYMPYASGAAALLGLLMGYGVAGIFARH